MRHYDSASARELLICGAMRCRYASGAIRRRFYAPLTPLRQSTCRRQRQFFPRALQPRLRHEVAPRCAFAPVSLRRVRRAKESAFILSVECPPP